MSPEGNASRTSSRQTGSKSSACHVSGARRLANSGNQRAGGKWRPVLWNVLQSLRAGVRGLMFSLFSECRDVAAARGYMYMYRSSAGPPDFRGG